MDIFGDLPALSKCPHCGHTGNGLQYAFPDKPSGGIDFSRVQAACLACGAHGGYRDTYADAAAAFEAGELEEQIVEDEVFQLTAGLL